MKTSETLTKADLSLVLREQLDLDKKAADLVVEVFLQCIVDALHRDEGVELRGFGSFKLRNCPVRQGRNPITGEALEVSAKRVAYFKPGKDLRNQLLDDPPEAIFQGRNPPAGRTEG